MGRWTESSFSLTSRWYEDIMSSRRSPIHPPASFIRTESNLGFMTYNIQLIG